jgi:hypothetical protein
VSVFVDTDDAFHTYRLEIDAAGDISVFYDGVLTLSGSSFTSASANGSAPRVGSGMSSSFSHGTAEWAFVEHDAGVGEPGTFSVIEPATFVSPGQWVPTSRLDRC